MVAKKKCQKSSDQDFHTFQEYLSMYQLLYIIYIYVCVRNIYISTIVPYEIDEIYPCSFDKSDHTVYLPASGSGPSSWRLKEA